MSYSQMIYFILERDMYSGMSVQIFDALLLRFMLEILTLFLHWFC